MTHTHIQIQSYTDEQSTSSHLDSNQPTQTPNTTLQPEESQMISNTAHTVEAASNLYQTQNGWQLIFALPDVDPQSIELKIVDHKIQLHALTQNQETAYTRSITFPPQVRWGEMNASWHHGLLNVTLNRAQNIESVIPIQVSI